MCRRLTSLRLLRRTDESGNDLVRGLVEPVRHREGRGVAFSPRAPIPPSQFDGLVYGDGKSAPLRGENGNGRCEGDVQFSKSVMACSQQLTSVCPSSANRQRGPIQGFTRRCLTAFDRIALGGVDVIRMPPVRISRHYGGKYSSSRSMFTAASIMRQTRPPAPWLR
jgi:hypothetical protein